MEQDRRQACLCAFVLNGKGSWASKKNTQPSYILKLKNWGSERRTEERHCQQNMVTHWFWAVN